MLDPLIQPTKNEGATALHKWLQRNWMRRTYEMSQHCGARMVRLRATGMAAELTYRTLFALIPLSVLGLVLFQIVGGMESVRSQVENQLFGFFGVPDIVYGDVHGDPQEDREAEDIVGPSATVVPPVARSRLGVPAELSASETSPDRVDLEGLLTDESLPPSPPIVAAQQAEERRAQASIRNTLRDLTSKVTGLDFASLGVAGLLLFIYAAIGLTDSVEADFNLVCESTRHRPWHLRMAIHWSILTIGSGLLAMSLYSSGKCVEWLAGHGGKGLAVTTLGTLLGFAAGWILLFLMYALMPNTRIQPRAALVGSFAAAVLWEVAKRGFQIYVSTAQPYANLYGSLGLIPLFLFWIYITWLIVLFGLFLTYSWQAYPGHPPTPEQDRLEAVLVPNSIWCIAALTEIGRAFQSGQAIDLSRLTETLQLPLGIVRKMIDDLEGTGLVLRSVQGGCERLAITRPLNRILISDLLRELTAPPETAMVQEGNAWQAFSHLQQVCGKATANMTLEDLIAV